MSDKPLKLTAQTLTDPSSAALLAEIEDIIRTMPTRSMLRQDVPETFSWLGRSLAAISRWDAAACARGRNYISQMQDMMAVTAQQGYLGLMVLLQEARSDLRFATLGPVNTAIGQGAVFDYFDEIRQIIELAKTDLLFIDPYLDAEFVSRYLPHMQSGVSVRLLAREKLTTLIPAAKLFAQQYGARLELRSASGFHDRYVIVDGKSCYQSGASFKDGGRTAPTTVTQITDAFSAVRQTYEDFWRNGKPEL
jgi:hypothetical protein